MQKNTIIALTIGCGLQLACGASLPLSQEQQSCLNQKTQREAPILTPDDPQGEKHPPSPKQGLQRAEIRGGLFKQDVKSKLQHGYEKGLAINGEYLWQSPDHVVFEGLLRPRPHLGATLNTRGSTSAAYVGLSWTFPKTSWWFIELSFGGALHNGRLKRNKAKRKGYGSRVLFRESVSLGLLFTNCHTVAVVLDHMSNARLAPPNPGLTNFGLRYGYVF